MFNFEGRGERLKVKSLRNRISQLRNLSVSSTRSTSELTKLNTENRTLKTEH
jgi:hypothetical protein